MNLLVTGGAGFIGSNFIAYYLQKHPEVHIVNIDKLTYAGSLDNLTEVAGNSNYTFVKGDICDAQLVNKIFKEYTINAVIHFAAESHVDNSIANPNSFVNTNLLGTFNLLEAARNNWLKGPGAYKQNYQDARFHHISTDEVYGSLGPEGYFNEQTPYAPNSPYSATKAGSDFLVRSYYHTYKLNVVTSNCSNNYGPKQHDEKLIPTIIRNALLGNEIPIYGKGTNVRDWLFVEDHCRAIDLIFNKGKSGETYVVGANNEIPNLTIAKKVCSILDEIKPKPSGSYSDQITFVQDRPGHDFRYAIDASKIQSELGWKPTVNFNEGLEKTVHWYLKKYSNKK